MTRSTAWVLPADGPRRARSAIASTITGSTGSGANDRTIRRRRIASVSSTCGPRRAGPRSGQLQQVVGRGPAERDQRVAALLVDLGEELGEARIQLLGVQRLVVQHLGVAVVAPDDEGT